MDRNRVGSGKVTVKGSGVAKLAVPALIATAGAWHPVSIVQPPDGALCTELWNCVGDSDNGSLASVAQR